MGLHKSINPIYKKFLAYKDGTVYVEPYLKEDITYSSGLTFAYPVSQIDKVLNSNNIEVTAVLAEDGLSATIAGASDGQIYTVYAPTKPEYSTIPTTAIRYKMNTGAYTEEIYNTSSIFSVGLGTDSSGNALDYVSSIVNGQTSLVVSGRTYTNKATTSGATISSLDSTKTYILTNTLNASVDVDGTPTATPAKITGITSTVLTWASGNTGFVEVPSAETSLLASVLNARYSYIIGTKSTTSVKLVSKDSENNIVSQIYLPPVGQSVGIVKDEISVVGGKGIKTRKVKTYTLQSADINTPAVGDTYADITYFNFPKFTDYSGKGKVEFNSMVVDGYAQSTITSNFNDANQIGKQLQGADFNYVWVGFAKGTTLEQARTALVGKALTYQLATPIITTVKIS